MRRCPTGPPRRLGGADPARALLLREVMRPAATIGAWHEQTIPPAATAGLHLEEFPDLAGRGAGACRAHARRARAAGAHRRPGHARPPSRAPRRGRAAPLGDRGRQFRRHAARPDPARRVPAADRAPDHRRRRAGDPARDPEASARIGRHEPGCLPAARARAGACLPARPAHRRRLCGRARGAAPRPARRAATRQADRLGRGPAGSGPAVRRAGWRAPRPISPR